MGDADSILHQVGLAFTDRLFIAVPSAEADLLETGVMDSLTLVNLIAELEQMFGIDILQQDFEIDRFRSLHSIAAFVGECRGLSRAAAGE